MKSILFFICFLGVYSLSAQKERVVVLEPPNDTISLRLSEIAEEVFPIPLSQSVGQIQFVYLTDNFLYVCGIRTIAQFDLSGRLIKVVDCGEFVTGITGNMTSKEIYVSMNNKKIKCYDYTLKEKKHMVHNLIQCLSSFLRINAGYNHTMNRVWLPIIKYPN